MDFVANIPRPIHFQRAMVFIDGTNLFQRLKSEKLTLTKAISEIIPHAGYVKGRQIVRIYMYTIEPHFKEAQEAHGKQMWDGIRIVYGDAIHRDNGAIKEKGVDALLVADLVYHAAVKNFDYALLVSVDTDFVHPIRRVESFGCRTGVLGVCSEVPKRLQESCDESNELSAEVLLKNSWATLRPKE